MQDKQKDILKKEVRKAADEIREIINYDSIKDNLSDIDKRMENDSIMDDLYNIFSKFNMSAKWEKYKKIVIAIVILIVISIPFYIFMSRPDMDDIIAYEKEENITKLCETVEYLTEDPYYKDFDLVKASIGAIARLNKTEGNKYIYNYITGPKIINITQRDELIKEVIANNKDYISFIKYANSNKIISNNAVYNNLGYFEFMYIFGVDKESKIKIAEIVYKELVHFVTYLNPSSNFNFQYFTEFYKLKNFIAGIEELEYLNEPINAYLDLTRDYDNAPQKYFLNDNVRNVGKLLVNNLKR